MTKEKKIRPQYNWKFKETESEEFYEWFNKQDNISSSLRSILYHIIDLYGSNNFLDPVIQKQVFRDTFVLDSLKDKEVLSVNHDLILGGRNTPLTDESNTNMHVDIVNSSNENKIEKSSSDEVIKEEVKTENIPQQKEKSNVFKDVNKNLF